MHHTIICTNEGLAIVRHNETRDKIIYISKKKLLIQQGRSRSEGGVRHAGRIIETQGDM